MKKTFLPVFLLAVSLHAYAGHFPLCMYGVNNPADVPLLKEAGFTCVQTYQRAPEDLASIAKAVQENQMQLVIYANQVLDSSYQQAAQNWPILAWYLVDEPDVWKWSRERVAAAHQKVKQTFPGHQTALVIGQGKTAVPYYDLSDNLMMDWYPVPHLALTSFGDNVRWAKEGQQAAGVGNRPLWGVVQAFNWKEFKQHRPDNDRIGRFPTQEEIRFMSYDGIINGAEGLFYFVFTTEGVPLPKAQPEHWARVAAVAQELAALRPILEQGTEAKPTFPVESPLAVQTRFYQKHHYIFLLNRSDQPVPAPKALRKKKYKILYGGPKAAKIPPYAVWVIKR